MIEDEPVHLHQCGAQVLHMVVPTSVLHDDIFQFSHGIAHCVAPVIHCEIHLLMTVKCVDVRIGSHIDVHSHTWFQH